MIGQFFTMLFSKIAAVIQWFADLFIAIFKSLWHISTDVFCWILEGVLNIAVSAANSFDAGSIDSALGNFNDLPAEMLNILGLLGFGSAMGIISTALIIRLGLQLIPFVRLGS